MRKLRSCLSQGSLFLHKHHDQEASWRGKVLFILHFPHCCSSPKEVRTGTQASQEAGADAENVEGYSYWLAFSGNIHNGPSPLDY